MELGGNFTTTLSEAINAKKVWFNATALPKVLESYQMLNSCVKNLYDLLEKQGLLVPDPYKVEQKFEDIELPPEDPIKESDYSSVMGIRFTQYESMVDFACNYYKFNTDFLTLEKIAKLNLLNNFIIWNSCTPANPKIHTKALASLLVEAKRKASSLSTSTINDVVHKSSDAITEITKVLKELSEFQKESYKLEIRKTVMSYPGFNVSAATESAESEIAEIKKNYAAATGKGKLYTDLITEISKEDFADNKEQLREAVLYKLKVPEQAQPKKQKVNPRTLLLESINSIIALDEEYQIVDQIVVNNYHVLENERRSIIEGLKKFFRAMFKLKPKPVIYTIMVEDTRKKTKYPQKLDINIFINNIERKAAFYTTLADHSSSEYQKIFTSEEEPLLQFTSKQIFENKEILSFLTGLDDYFKTKASPKNKSKIKGLKMELLTLQNAIIKANQKRAEYITNVEETNQMRRLGINSSEI